MYIGYVENIDFSKFDPNRTILLTKSSWLNMGIIKKKLSWNMARAQRFRQCHLARITRPLVKKVTPGTTLVFMALYRAL